MNELDKLRKVIEILQDGQVGNQAIFECANQLPKDQSDWGKLIVQKALELAIMEVFTEDYEEHRIYNIPDDELPGMWEKVDFMGGQY